MRQDRAARDRTDPYNNRRRYWQASRLSSTHRYVSTYAGQVNRRASIRAHRPRAHVPGSWLPAVRGLEVLVDGKEPVQQQRVEQDYGYEHEIGPPALNHL